MSATDPVTTVKVPRSLRERIARDAAETGQTAAGFLTAAVDAWERQQRFAAVRRAHHGPVDDAYRGETAAWSSVETDLPSE